MLRVSSSPHIRDNSSTRRIMLDVALALIPMVIASVLIFGWRALLIYAVSIASCVVFEALTRMVMKREQTINDLSAVVTGLLLAAGLPAGYPIWMVVLGAFIAIVFVKQLFGGLGGNFANPAVTARVILAVSFATASNSFSVLPQYAYNSSAGASQVDLVSSATPLGLSAGDISSLDLFLGTHAGSIGETCILALVIGALYLLIRGVIDLWIPLVYLGATIGLITLVGGDPLYHLLSGALVLAAFFMLTDYVTSPTTTPGKIIFAFGAAVLTFLLRMYSSMPEGVSYSILLMNILNPHIERWTAHKTIGGYYGKKRSQNS
ncbi:MAG: RnfABCDGE type electron transport complex subunit D [Fastidiosipila sp.]|nr:RnfABCDGE type electron transport complex subunit D [Fastidiosipila sp.]